MTLSIPVRNGKCHPHGVQLRPCLGPREAGQTGYHCMTTPFPATSFRSWWWDLLNHKSSNLRKEGTCEGEDRCGKMALDEELKSCPSLHPSGGRAHWTMWRGQNQHHKQQREVPGPGGHRVPTLHTPPKVHRGFHRNPEAPLSSP